MSALLCLLAALPSPGQVTTATFYGSVTDTSQAVLPGASISMTHQGTGAANAKVSDERGEFAFIFLPAGIYTLKIELPGFKTYVSAGFELGAAQNVRRTFALEVGGVAEQVTVTSEAPLVNTVAPEQRHSYSSLQVTELPLANRDFTAVLSSATGVTTGGTTIRMNGVGGVGTNITVDGTAASGFPEAPSGSTYGSFNYISLVSIDAIAEVQTTKGIIAAEYADTMSGNVNVITKSGTNQWHGSLFENYTGAALNARVQTATTKPPLTFNQFGGSAGGPLRKDKIFVFGTYEGYREAGQQVTQGNVPTERLRQAMIAAIPDYRLYMDRMFPIPNQPHDPNGTIGRWQGPMWYSLDENHATFRLDVIQFGNGNLSGTYARSRPNRNTPELLNRLAQNGKQERVTASYVIGRPSWTSETRFGYNYSDVLRLDDLATIKDPKNDREVVPGGRRLPTIQGLNFFAPTGELFFMGGATWTVENKVSKILGRHALKFGGIYARRGSGRENFENPEITYANERDLLANVPSQVRTTFGYNPFTSHMDDWGLFIQDDWRMTPKLTLNLGIRYDNYRNYVVKPKDPRGPAVIYNYDGLKDPENFIYGPLRPENDPIEPDYLNIGPRFGFAYNPDGQSRNVIRGGFGLMFTSRNNSSFNSATSKTLTLPFRRDFTGAESAARGFRYPTYNADVEQIVTAENKVAIAALYEPRLEAPYVMNMYLGVQRALTGSMMFESAFVGTRGVKFLLTRWFNQINRVTGLRPNQDLPFEGYYYDMSQQTFYASWQSSVRKQFSKNLSWNLHHTWGKGLSYGGGNAGAVITGDASRNFVQDFNNVKINRAPSTGDRTHVVTADWVYQLPEANFSRVLREVVGGWQVSGIFRAETGDAFDVTQLGPGLSANRPDIIDIKHTVLPDYRKTGKYLNVAAFAKVQVSPVSRVPIRPGNAGFRAVRGPGDWTVDLGLGKNFSPTENVKLHFRVDMFNALNHTNLGNPIASIDNPEFGKITTTRGARRIQANARLSF
jgi:outer membrane receptor protein involved in Fe transport